MNQIIEINRRSVFTLEEVQQVLPIVFRITKSHSQKVDALIKRLETVAIGNEKLVHSIETQVNSLIQEWQSKIQRLGALPKGLWIADFDSGDGYFCWKFPERGIDYWHKYTDGFSRRIPIRNRKQAKSTSPQNKRPKKILAAASLVLQPHELRE